MSIFDLLFLAAAFATLVTLLTVAVLAISGRRARALKILEILGVCAVVYLAIGLAVSFLKPQRVFAIGDPWCADDWCLSVQQVTHTPAQSYVSYNVSLKIFSQAKRVAQRARGAWLVIIDDRGRRYSPEPDPSAVPLDVLLQPGESVAASRVFRIPADVHAVGIITEHGGPYCGPLHILIIGESGCVFNKPTMIRIQ